METGKLICDICGKTIIIGSREDGLPDAVSFKKDTGHKTVCTDCLIAFGKKKKEEGSDDIRFI